MRTTNIAAAVAAALSIGATAQAADIARPVYKAPVAAPVYNWSGFYVGMNAGSAWADARSHTSMTCLLADQSCPYGPAQFPAVAAAGSATLSDQAFTGGGQVGLNWQTGRLVYGFEVDLQSFKLAATRSGSATDPSDATNLIRVTSTLDSDWLFTARGRLGWLVAPNLLLYGTGGLAATELGVHTAISSDSLQPGAGSATGRLKGWAIGGGAEWALSANWTLRAEYLHLDLGKVTANAPIQVPVGDDITNNMATTVDLTAEVVRAALNYKF